MAAAPTLLTSSPLAGMQRLAVRGIFVADCHEQLRGIILRGLGPQQAALLAEPACDPVSRRVDWYTSRTGQAVPLAALPEEEARALREKTARYVAEIHSLARQEAAHAAGGGSLSADLLSLAVSQTDDGNLWSVGGEPVLVNWGYAAGMDGVLPQDLARLGTTAPAPAVAPATPAPPLPPQRTGCAGWLLPLLLLLLLFWLLLSALGWLPLWLPASCVPQPDRSALQAEQERAGRLESELDSLLRQLREKAELCRPAPPPAPDPAPAPEPPVEQPRADVVEPFFGETPVEPDPVPAPKPQPAPAPSVQPKPAPKPAPRPAPRKGEEMQIPKDAAQKKDLSFLEGCWSSETGLTSSRTGGPVVVEYCFDKNGRGRRFVREEGGRVCSGPSQARFTNGQLQFDAGPATCPRGGRFVPQRVDCRGSQDRTQCRGQELDGKKSTWKARFRRK